MHFKLISVGWECGDAFYDTLRSIGSQSHNNWQAHVVDDGSSAEQQAKIAAFCEHYNFDPWMCTFHNENRGATRNQYEGIRAMNPDDEDVIVFLDLDGDQLAHTRVLERLEHYYGDGHTLMTYGSYEPRPMQKNFVCPVSPYPKSIELSNTYRESTVRDGTRYNHLRTVKWKVLKQIPLNYFMFSPDEWIYSPTDLIVMMGCLELVGGRYKCIEEVLCLHNENQPHPDNKRNPDRNVRGSQYTFGLPPLEKITQW